MSPAPGESSFSFLYEIASEKEKRLGLPALQSRECVWALPGIPARCGIQRLFTCSPTRMG